MTQTGVGARAAERRASQAVRSSMGRPRRPIASASSRAGDRARSGRPASVLLVCFCLCAQWSGIFIGPFQLSDLLLLGFLASLLPRTAVLYRRRPYPDLRIGGEIERRVRSISPTGPVVFVLCVASTQVLYQFLPVSHAYLEARANALGAGAQLPGPTASALGLGAGAVLIRFVLALGGGWVVARYAAGFGVRGWSRLIAVPWLLGAVTSASVALLASAHVIDIAGALTQETGERASGLAFHPNSLGLYLASAIPFLTPLLESRARVLLGLVFGVVIWGGLLAADSRIALVVAAVHTVALPFYARRTARAAVVTVVVALLCAPLVPRLAGYATHHTRLFGDSSSASDAGRSDLYRQALTDFMHSPVFGVGLQNGGGPPSVPLGMLAGGGLIAATGYVFFWGWCIRAASRALAVPQVRSCLASGLGILVCGWFQNNVTDRGEYLLILSAVCLAGVLNTDSGSSSGRLDRQRLL